MAIHESIVKSFRLDTPETVVKTFRLDITAYNEIYTNLRQAVFKL